MDAEGFENPYTRMNGHGLREGGLRSKEEHPRFPR
jgi:hypothetical protein